MIALAPSMRMLWISARREGDTSWSDRSSHSSSWRKIARAMRSTRVPAGRLAVHSLFEPLEHVEGVLLERAEETLRLDRVTGVVRAEGTLRGRRSDLQTLASSSDVMSTSGSRWCVVGTSDSSWKPATARAALGAHVSRQGRVTHCIGARAQLSRKYQATASCVCIVRAERVSCYVG